jgi:hypothetical protein
VVLALTLPLLAVSATFMSNRSRPDHIVYARYNDAIVWPVIAIGVAWTITSLRRGRWGRVLATVGIVALTFAGTTALVYGLHGDTLAERIGVRPMIPGWLPIIGDENAIRVIRIAVIALILMMLGVAVLWLLSRGGRRAAVGLVIVAAAFGWAGWRTHHALALRLNSWGEAAAVVEADAMIPPDTEIGFRFVSDKEDPAADWTSQRRRAQLYQMYLPHRTFVRDHGTDDSVGPYVFAPVNDPDMRDADADVLWTDPTVRVALWREVIEP